MRSSSERLAGGLSVFALLVGITACGSDGSAGASGPAGPQGTAGGAGTPGVAGSPGPQGAAAPTPVVPTSAPAAVYTMSNDATYNEIFVYDRAADGSLAPHDAYQTGGKGTGASLGDQGALAFSSTKNLLLAVNAGDNSISALALKLDGSLALVSKVDSGGVSPVSVTIFGESVYVLNAGDATNAANVSGFHVDAGGLTAVANSTQPLSAASPGAAQIQFTPDGKILVVTEKTTNMIDTYVTTDGVAGSPKSQPSVGATPYGFAFGASGQLVVSEATPGAASSYTIAADGTITPVSSSIVSSQAAPCWVAMAGKNAFVANAHSNTLTGYGVATDGSITLIGSGGISAATGGAPTDLAATAANDFLYALNSKDHSLSAFTVADDGSLGVKPVFAGLPEHAEGLIAR